MADAVWESYKPDLERLYIRENKTLTQVMEYMTSMYGFDERKSQYEKNFKRWGFQKNQHLTPAEGKFLGRRMGKRKREENKESEVYIKGVQYPPHKVKKVVYGKAFVSTLDRLPDAPSPNTPEGILVCTPGTPGMRLQWGASLPWLRFSKLLQRGINSDLTSLLSTFTATSPPGNSPSTNHGSTEVMQHLNSILLWERFNQQPNPNTRAAALSILMPEEYEDQHRALAVRLCSSQATAGERLNLELFLLSNNLISHGGTFSSNASLEAHDKRVMKMFHSSGWNNIKQIKVLLSIQEPTAGAIAEKLFATAIRLSDLDAVRMMLKAGMNPNSPIQTVAHGALTPLQFAANRRDDHAIDTIELFIGYGSDINFSYNGNSVLHYAFQRQNSAVTRLLLSHGAIVIPPCFENNGVPWNMDFFTEFVEPHADICTTSEWHDADAFAQAVRNLSLPLVKLFLARGADINALIDIDYDGDWGLTSILGLAVHSGELEVIQAILDARKDINPKLDGVPFISPLTLAVRNQSIKTTEMLIEAGVDIQTADEGSETLLECALKMKNTMCKRLDICKLLVAYGARVNRPFWGGIQESSALFIAIQKDFPEIIDLLVESGARLNDMYSDAPGTVLAAAVEKGDLALIHKLEDAGATMDGSILQRIGNLDTGLYLQERGALRESLDTCGPRILISALLDHKNDLTQWLLDHDVDFGPNLDDVKVEDIPKTPLAAAIRASISFVEPILAHGAKVLDYDLAEAVAQDEIDLLQHLLGGFLGSAPTALGIAIMNEDIEVLQIILGAGVDPTGMPRVPQYEGDDDHHFQLDPPESILEIAAQENNIPILHILIQSCPWDSRLTGRALVLAILFNNDEIADKLLNSGADTNQEIVLHHFEEEDENGNPIFGWDEIVTPLQIAAKKQQLPMVQKLIKNNHPLTDINYLGEGVRRRTALQHAVETGNLDLVRLLLEHGAKANDVPARDGGATALQIAAIQGYLGIARMLLNEGADVNAAPAAVKGRTALQGVAEHGRIDMLQMFLDEGVSLEGDYCQSQYQRAIDLAKRNGHNATAKLLIRFREQAEGAFHQDDGEITT